MNKGQKQWRHGFMMGVKRANGLDESERLTAIKADDFEQMKRDSLLVAIMRDMGAFDAKSRPGGCYLHGTEQAFLILSDLSA